MSSQRSTPFLSSALLAVLLAGATAWAAEVPAASAMPKKEPPPPPAAAKDVKFPAFAEKTLANGLKVVVIESHEQPAVSVRLLVPGGKVFDPADKAGLAQATASLLNQGAAGLSAQQIAEKIDAVGGSLAASASQESAQATVQVTVDQLGLGLQLLADIALRPSFPLEELERWRRQAASNLQIEQESTSYLADAAMIRLLYSGHPYGLPGSGTPESLNRLTQQDLVAFHRAHYTPNRSILAVVGDVRPADAFAQVERFFGAWAQGPPTAIPLFKPPTSSKHTLVVIDKPDAVQTEIRIGLVTVPFLDPKYFTAVVYNAVVGNSASSRLFNEVRMKRGLSYGAYSFIGRSSQPAIFEAGTSTKTESTVEALSVSLDVLRGLETTPVPAAELASSKAYLTGAFPLEIETPDSIADQVLEAMKFGLGKEFLESYNSKIEAVTAEQVQAFARRWVPADRTVLVLAGNAAAFSAELEKKFGPFKTISYKDVDLLRADLQKVPAAPAPAQPGS
jgi:zinc protease